MIHFFNPGHETAVLNASKHYHPPAHVAKMQVDLALLPAWYASEGDYIFTGKALLKLCHSALDAESPEKELLIIRGLRVEPAMTKYSAVDLWGVSPQSVHLFEKINEQYNLSLKIPQWKEEFRFLGSRFAAQKALAKLMDRIPEIEKNILPQFFSDIEAIEQQIIQSREKHLLKSPYSSSGRGLIWLPPGKLAQSERQIINGMLRKQSQVSLEMALDKCLDFSMQFEITELGVTNFTGYSIFQTNLKGAYEKSHLNTQDKLENQITAFINIDLLMRTKAALTEILQKMYAPYYNGIIGVDMLIYRSGNIFRLHPCVEVNMRKNMGYLATRFSEKYLHPGSHGSFSIDFATDTQTIIRNHKKMQEQFPLLTENGRIKSGYFSLCPINNDTNYRAFVLIYLYL